MKKLEISKDSGAPFLFEELYDDALETGIENMDSQISGLRPGALYLLGSVPGMGKSAMTLSLATNLCCSQKIPILYASLDKKHSFLGDVISQLSELPKEDILSGNNWHKYNQERLDAAIIEIEGSKLNTLDFDDFLDFKYKSNNDIGNLIKDLAASDIEALIIDDIERLIEKTGDKVNDYSKSYRLIENLKLVALKLNIPVFATCSISKEVHKRAGHRPQIIDFKTPGVEEISDVLLTLFRRDFYDPLDKPGIAELGRKEIRQFMSYSPLKYVIDPEMALDEEVMKSLKPFSGSF
jgi:replicative DNA helicase